MDVEHVVACVVIGKQAVADDPVPVDRLFVAADAGDLSADLSTILVFFTGFEVFLPLVRLVGLLPL